MASGNNKPKFPFLKILVLLVVVGCYVALGYSLLLKVGVLMHHNAVPLDRHLHATLNCATSKHDPLRKPFGAPYSALVRVAGSRHPAASACAGISPPRLLSHD